MANKAGLRGVVGVGVGTSKSKSGVESIGGRGITRSKSNNHSLSSCDSIFGSLVGTTSVGHLVVDAVGDDGWVESLLLALVAERILSLESPGSCCTAVQAELELHGGDAETEVETSNGGCHETIESTGDWI